MKKKIFSVLLALVLVCSFSLVTAVPVAAQVDEVWVDDDAEVGWYEDATHFETIQAAIAAVDPPGTVNVAAGTYEEAVTIDKSLTLEGEDRETTELKFGYGAYPSLPPLIISADEVTVSGFTIRSGPRIEAAFGVLSGWAFTIIVDGDSALLTDLHVIKDALLDASNRPRIGGSAFWLAPGLEGFTFTDSIVESEWNGISAEAESKDITVRNVDFTYPGEWAIILKMVTGATIEENTFTCTGHSMANTDSQGIVISRGSTAIEIRKNQFIGSSQPVFARSHIGILLQAWKIGPVGVSILGNDISDFDRGIKVEAEVETSGIHINYNSITGDTYSVENLALTTVDATNNWWGHASGPAHDSNPLGTGDAVSDNVLFDPWLKAPYRPTTPMSSFTIDHAKVDFKKKADDDKVRVQGKLELDLVNGNGVDISEDVIVTVGPLSETITMEQKGKKGEKWQYKRPKDGEGDIKHMTINWKNGKFDIRMDKAELTGITNPVTISIQIGDDVGEESITMREKKHHWDYKAK